MDQPISRKSVSIEQLSIIPEVYLQAAGPISNA